MLVLLPSFYAKNSMRNLLLIVFVATLSIGLTLSEYQLASSLFASSEKLYPVKITTTTPIIATTAAPEPLPVAQANPFLPVRAPLPAVPEIALPQVTSTFNPAELLMARGIELSAFTSSASGIDSTALTECQTLVAQTLTVLPDRLTASLNDLTLFFSARNPRGLSNSRTLELRCADLADSEIVSVLVHELGHVSDLGGLRGTGSTASEFHDGKLEITTDDPSVEFYRLSWIDEKSKKYRQKRIDFVSGYAMSDPFEDFAESFDYYTLHGADFRLLSTESTVLQAKYDFLRNTVFAGAEYDSALTASAGKRVWDTTLVTYDLTKFLNRNTTTTSRDTPNSLK